MEKHWFVFYTKSRHEQKVDELLRRRGYQSFLPMVTEVRQWSDRKKKVITPLFKSYLFVHSFEYQINEILTTPGISWNVKYNGKPAVVRLDEIELINRFIETGLFVQAVPAHNLSTGDKVLIVDGPLKGLTGYLTSKDSDEFTVHINSIQQNLKVRLPSYMFKKLSN